LEGLLRRLADFGLFLNSVLLCGRQSIFLSLARRSKTDDGRWVCGILHASLRIKDNDNTFSNGLTALDHFIVLDGCFRIFVSNLVLGNLNGVARDVDAEYLVFGQDN
jgi:hypothetical protein